MSFTPHLSCICHLFSRFSCYLLDSGLIILISIVFFSLFLISRHSAVSVHPFYSLFFFFHFYPPFSISNPLSSFICPSIPPLEKVTFAVKCSSPPLYHTVKKCRDIMSLVDIALIFPLMSLASLSFSFSSDSLSARVCVSLPSRLTPHFLRGQGLHLTLCQLFPFMLPSG